MVSLVFALPPTVVLLCLIFGRVFGSRFPAKWWFWRLLAAPAIGFFLSLYIILTPAELAPNYDPMIHGNPGRLDFAAIVIYGLALPVLYLLAVLPSCLAYVIWQGRK
ncbi:hypothetical protein [Sphingorhabdus sp.]|uniref:hypothetical protein n=1 Tax=Sphingorhabdus sp. TaxID=1902408 RepID=UPI0032B7ACD2